MFSNTNYQVNCNYQENGSCQVQVYAGFWARLAAYLIDLVLVCLGQLVVRLVLFLSFGMLWENNPLDQSFLFQYTFRDGILYAAGVVYFVLCTYYAGATLGKKALNLKVISANEEPLTLINVLYRESIGRFLSAFLLGAGYILVGITNEKKGLHDILCDTRVVYEKKIPTYINGDINKRYQQVNVSGAPPAGPAVPMPPRGPSDSPVPPKGDDKPPVPPVPVPPADDLKPPTPPVAVPPKGDVERPVPPAPPTSSASSAGDAKPPAPPRAPMPPSGDIYDRYIHVDPNKKPEQRKEDE